ncbi:MAG: hypothetical protein IPJ41_17420 [Phycisphaerales bacterium]|nr:hypothetical protein [Phycisphaerales bacterium]
MARFRTFLLVTFVTILIWAFAEGESLQTKRTVAEIEFPPVSGGTYAVRLPDDPNWRGRVELLVEGSTASLDSLDTVLRRPLKLAPGMEGVPRDSGEHVLDIRQVLRNHPDFRTRGVSVVAAEPPTVRVTVDELRSVDIPVRVDVPAGEIQGSAEPDPARISVRLPARIADQLTPAAALVARVRSEDLAKLTVGQQTVLRDVRLEPGPELAGVQPLEMARTLVNVSLAVRSKTETTVLSTVQVDVRLPPGELGRWDIQVPTEEQSLRDVKVTGPSELIERIKDTSPAGLKIRAFIRLSYEDLEAGISSKRAEFADLPGPLTFEVEDRDVRLTIKHRDATPADSRTGGSPAPAN